MRIVLDKSYLYGAGAKRMEKFCSSYETLMPESLFYELLTTSPDNRAKCFSNLPKRDNPLILVKNIGFILRYEVEKKVPFSDIIEVSVKKKVFFQSQFD